MVDGKVLIALILSVLLSGCSLFAYPDTPMSVHIHSKMPLDFSTKLVEGAHWALKTLQDCDHPALEGRLEKLEHIEFRYGDRYTCNHGHYCACAIIADEQNMIWVRREPYMWDGERCDVIPTICHEMLHLLGFMHGSLFNEIEWECCIQ